MKLKLTDIEFSVLAELVFAGNWVINSSRLPNEIMSAYSEMEEKITTLYADRKKLKNKLDRSFSFDDRLESYFDFYAHRTMYRTLSEQYAARTHPGADKKTLSEQADAYFDELCQNGLINVAITLSP